MKGFSITDINFHQPMVILPGTYTYSCKATPVGNSITFRVGTIDFIIDGLTPGVYQTGIKKTFTIETQQANFYLSRTIGDKIFEPQLEYGTVATTPGPHILDGPEEIERAGIRITSEMAQIYASKDEMYSEISITANQITQSVSDISGRVSTVEQTISGITQRISDTEGNISTVEQTVNSWSSTITSAGKIASQILQDGENVKITATNIILEGAITTSGYFKILQDGSIEAINGKFTGKISSNASGNRITIDAGDRSFKMINSSNYDILKMFFYDTEGISYPVITLEYIDNGTSKYDTRLDALGLQSTYYSTPGAYGNIGPGTLSIGGGGSSVNVDIYDTTRNTLELYLTNTAISGFGIYARRLTAGGTLTARDSFVSMINSSAATVYLPGSPTYGRTIFIKKEDAAVTVNGNGKSLRTASSTVTSMGIPDVGNTLMCIYDGTYWQTNIL